MLHIHARPVDDITLFAAHEVLCGEFLEIIPVLEDDMVRLGKPDPVECSDDQSEYSCLQVCRNEGVAAAVERVEILALRLLLSCGRQDRTRMP